MLLAEAPVVPAQPDGLFARLKFRHVSSGLWNDGRAQQPQGTMRGITLAAFALGLTACTRTFVDFKPYSSTVGNFRPVMSYAVVAYEGDISTLAQVGGVVVGTLNVSGNGYADTDDVRSRAMDEAARVGGTHLLVAGEGSSTNWAQITPDRATTTVYGNTATTTYTPGAEIPITRHRGAFVVVRVPPERWLDLPSSLRPVSGRHFKGAYPGQREVTGAPGSADPVTAPIDGNWFCTSDDATTMGMCFRAATACQDTYEQLKQYGSKPCVAWPEATCFSVKRGPSAQISCHPTMQACRSQRDYAFGQGNEIIRECTSTP